MSSLPAVVDRGSVTRQEFGGIQTHSQAETAVAAVAARERAKVEAMYVMAERHPRNWDTVRVRLLGHCDRPGFAEIARYKKPSGRKYINGKWQDTFAEGLSARFAEIARQEAGNISTESSVVYEDDLIRIVRASVMDLERNNNDSRELTVAKAVERKGKKNDKTGDWEPPEGREVIGTPRLNSYGEPVWLVKATDDEIRNRQNSEISKAQRDESLRLIPKDIRDDCEARIIATLHDPKKVDPTAARKKVIDAFSTIGVLPDDLVTYIGCELARVSPAQLDELRGLYTAIRDGETDFQSALKLKYGGDQATGSSKDARVVADEKLKAMDAEPPAPPPAPGVETPSTRPPHVQPEDKVYTPEDLPDAGSVALGTEVLYDDKGVRKRLRVVAEDGEAPTWKAIGTVAGASAAAPQSAPRQAPKFTRGGAK